MRRIITTRSNGRHLFLLSVPLLLPLGSVPWVKVKAGRGRRRRLRSHWRPFKGHFFIFMHKAALNNVLEVDQRRLRRHFFASCFSRVWLGQDFDLIRTSRITYIEKKPIDYSSSAYRQVRISVCVAYVTKQQKGGHRKSSSKVIEVRSIVH